MTRPLVMTRSASRTGWFIVCAVLVPSLLLGCPSKPAMIVDDAAPPPPTPLAEASIVTELVPLMDDAGPDAADAAETAPPKKRTASPIVANQAKIKVCCNAMRAQAKQMGASPEGYQLNTMATQCDAFAAQIGPQGTAPELSQFRDILKTIKLPSACAF